jgi:hypothetical protein
VLQRLTRSQQFILLGAAITLILGELILGELLGGGGLTTIGILAAEVGLLVLLAGRRGQWPLDPSIIVAALVTAIVVIAVADVLAVVHDGGDVGGGLGLLVRLCDWVGALLMAIGVYLDWQPRAA